jgi:phosphoadenosine phosphosulfate reductase
VIEYFCKSCNINVESSECSVCGARTEVKSKLYWCVTCNIPIYDEICPICGCKGEYFTSDARPVFPEERLLIEIMLGKPFCFMMDSVWNGSGNRYYVNGKKVPFSVTNLKKYDPDEIRRKLDELKGQNTYIYFEKIIAKWINANATRYDYITSEAKSYISQYSKKYLNDDLNAAFVSFSGGKDSTVVSDLVRKATGNPSIIHIFGNTTLEFPQTYEYIERFRTTNKRTPMLRAENKEQDFFNLCETFGPPSRTLRWCCTIFKTGFIGEKIKKTFNGRKTVLTFYGIRRNESASRNTYERSSQGKKITQQLVASPIIDWMDYDIWLYLLTTGIDFNEAYRLGYTRVGCWCCPNNSGWSQFLASIYMPEQYKRFRNILLDFAIKMGKEDPEEYVTSGGWKARQGGAGIELSKNVAISFKPCATDAKSFNYVLNRPISDDLYEFFKPFGLLDFTMGKERLGEVYILDFKTKQPIIKLQGRHGTNELRITILSTPIAGKKKINEIERKFKCQITKFQLCAGCHACENICKHSAIRLIKEGEEDTEYKYLIDETKCIHCFECINHYTGGCYMRRVLLPRGKGYTDDK